MLSRILQSTSLYDRLARMRWPRSYAGKMLFVAFVGTHVPFIALVVYFLGTTSPSVAYTVRVGLIALIATLLGTAATLAGLRLLLAPVLLTQRALRDYLEQRTLPELPTTFTDEAGTLMADTQHTLRQLDEVVQRLENYDDVTALPNRTLFAQRVTQAVAQCRRSDRCAAVIAIEVDHVEAIALSIGHDASDMLMRAVAQRLAIETRDSDVLARVADRAFAVLNADAGSFDALMAQARRYSDALALPFRIAIDDRTHTVVVKAAVGIAAFPSDAADAEELLRNAHSALHDARSNKSAGGTSAIRFYSAETHTKLQARIAMEREMRQALESGQFYLDYQPKVAIHTGRATEVEALVRWRHPERGIVSPMEFIPVAEQSGFIVPLGEWVLREACLQAWRWLAEGRPLRVAVNLSAQQIARTDVVALVQRVLAETYLPPSLLEVEVTESVLATNVSHAAQVLNDLRDLGVRIALDDFGTGYSSLSYLRQLPVDVVKIDRSFVRELGDSQTADAVVNAVLAMARGLNLSVVAEGVETQSQLEYLRARGCDVAQGYLFGKPTSPAALLKLSAIIPRAA
ncbi:MAG TPA: bifunctional diguanylate cyclase/phosphodiesterase [Gemmatimonadaceae bacterium]|jgi:diguanylate cyclase (GGDEF)-like protein